MSDMASRISVRLDEDLRKRLSEEASLTGKNESQILREALQARLRKRGRQSCYELARKSGVIGSIKSAPRDLSRNPRHFRGFGK